jgi:hypothetical protein
MPFNTPEKKLEWTRRWNKQGKEIGYNKWLYDQRKLRFDDAVAFRGALERIADGEYHAASIAKTYLKESDRRRADIGPSPRKNGVPVPVPDQSREGDTLAEALAKLGLK